MRTEHDGALMGWKGCMAPRQPYPENRSPRALAMKEFACDAPPWSESKCRWLKSQFVLMMWLNQENELLEENGHWSRWRMSGRAWGLEQLICEERSDSL